MKLLFVASLFFWLGVLADLDLFDDTTGIGRWLVRIAGVTMIAMFLASLSALLYRGWASL